MNSEGNTIQPITTPGLTFKLLCMGWHFISPTYVMIPNLVCHPYFCLSYFYVFLDFSIGYGGSGKMNTRTQIVLFILKSSDVFQCLCRKQREGEHIISNYYSVLIYPNPEGHELCVCLCMNLQWRIKLKCYHS